MFVRKATYDKLYSEYERVLEINDRRIDKINELKKDIAKLQEKENDRKKKRNEYMKQYRERS